MMQAKFNTNLFVLVAYLSWQAYVPVQAQSKSSVGVRAGYLYSTTQIKTTNTTFSLEGIDAKGGYYAGLMYGYSFSNRWVGRLELEYQNKGQVTRNRDGIVISKYSYGYVGIIPTIGVNVLKNLSVSVGPEVNVLLSATTRWGDARPVEVGVVGKGTYQFNRVLLNVGYFKGLTRYDRTSIVLSSFDFLNQSWQVGLTYLLK